MEPISRRARLFRGCKVGASFVIVSLLLFLVFAPRGILTVYATRLDCSRVDVSNGIMQAFQSSLNNTDDSDDVGINMDGVSMTTSEIDILTQYTQEQVRGASQFIHSNLLGWCYGSYDSVEAYDSGSSDFQLVSHGRAVMQCSKLDINYAFDYRQQLADAGLNIVLSYAYPDTSGSWTDEYNRAMAKRKQQYSIVILMLMGGIIVHFLMFAVSALYYIKLAVQRKRQDENEEEKPHHTSLIDGIFGVAAIIASLLLTVSILMQVASLHDVRDQIATQLGAFGIHLHIGSVWIGIFWFTVAASWVTIFLWGGPVWCTVSALERQVDMDAERMPLRQYSEYNDNNNFSNNSNSDDFLGVPQGKFNAHNSSPMLVVTEEEPEQKQVEIHGRVGFHSANSSSLSFHRKGSDYSQESLEMDDMHSIDSDLSTAEPADVRHLCGPSPLRHDSTNDILPASRVKRSPSVQRSLTVGHTSIPARSNARPMPSVVNPDRNASVSPWPTRSDSTSRTAPDRSGSLSRTPPRMTSASRSPPRSSSSSRIPQRSAARSRQPLRSAYAAAGSINRSASESRPPARSPARIPMRSASTSRTRNVI